MSTKNPAHQMPINDIEYAWMEDRYIVTPDGKRGEPWRVFLGKCICGEVFEGKDSTEVTKSYLTHVHALENA